MGALSSVPLAHCMNEGNGRLSRALEIRHKKGSKLQQSSAVKRIRYDSTAAVVAWALHQVLFLRLALPFNPLCNLLRIRSFLQWSCSQNHFNGKRCFSRACNQAESLWQGDETRRLEGFTYTNKGIVPRGLAASCRCYFLTLETS